MTNIQSWIRGGVAVALGFSAIVISRPVQAQVVVAQQSSPVSIGRCDFDIFNRYVYNVETHYDLLASFTNRSSKPATLVGIITEFFDEQGNLVRRLEAAYSGRFAPGQFVDHLRFGLGGVPNPTATVRCFVARVEFADGSVWSVADHYAEVERPPVHCDIALKNGTSFEASWYGPLCADARQLWADAHASLRPEGATPGG